MLGVSLKLWRMDWLEEDSCFSTVDSSVFVFQDRLDEELVYVQNIIRLHPLLFAQLYSHQQETSGQ